LDFGTRSLLESIDIKNISGEVLDFGCGYGPIGIYVASLTNSNVDMIDINERALNLARCNASINKVNVNIFESNIYSNITKKYDYIITNPPIRVGKKILYEILTGAKEHLKENGHLIFVINKDQGAKSTMKDMEKYYKVNLVSKNKGFFIIDCENH
jgi:16S rRNA (guanine1207-N2)-methyltransferase